MSGNWDQRRGELLERAKKLRAQPVVSREEVLALQEEIRYLESRIDRSLPPGMMALRTLPSLTEEKVGRVPAPDGRERTERRCPLGSCDGSGWHLHESEDVVEPCACQALPRDRSSRRQTKRILRRHLALGLDAPPLSQLEMTTLECLRAFDSDLRASIEAGEGLWLCGEKAEIASAFLAGQAMRRSVPVLLYPGDELIGRLRRLAGAAASGLEAEIYEHLATVEFLVITDLDAAAAPVRYPQQAVEPTEEGRAKDDGDGEEPDIEGAEEEQGVPYAPAMNDSDLTRIAQIVDQRWMNERSTVISTAGDQAELEERFLRVSGDWPGREDGARGGGGGRLWDEPRRRVLQFRQLNSRLRGLCGEPLRAE